jgi:serine/threonine-protein kinase
LGALVLAAALLAIVVTNPEVDGTTASDSQQEETTAAEDPTDTPAPALSTPGGSEDPTSAPATTASVETPTATETGGSDPLGLGVAMTSPACDGTWVVILGSATDPASYAAGVTALLSSNPEAKYVLTQGACSSLRQQTADGDQIYAVYLGPYPDQAAACEVSTGIGGGVYVKRMDATTPADQTWEC